MDEYDIREAAERLAISESSLRRRVDDGKIPALPGKPLRFSRATIDAEQARLLRRMHVVADVAGLQAQVVALNRTVTALRQSNAMLLDAIRELQPADVPNN